jgi:hypothetical protein
MITAIIKNAFLLSKLLSMISGRPIKHEYKRRVIGISAVTKIKKNRNNNNNKLFKTGVHKSRVSGRPED